MIKQKRVKLSPRKRRARHVRRKIKGTAERPRLSVNRTLKHISVQLIDDVKGVSIGGISSDSNDFRSLKVEGKVGIAKEIGKKVAEIAKEKGVEKVVFDRSGYLYHGRVKAVADGAREGGLKL